METEQGFWRIGGKYEHWVAFRALARASYFSCVYNERRLEQIGDAAMSGSECAAGCGMQNVILFQELTPTPVRVYLTRV